MRSHDHAIQLKAEIMVDHSRDQVVAQNEIGGAAGAMVGTNGIERAVQYYDAIRDYLDGAKVTEASLNGLPSSRSRPDLFGGGGRGARAALPRRGGPRQARSEPGRLRGGLPE